MAWRSSLFARVRSWPGRAWRMREDAAEHSVDHHRTPRGSGALRREKRDALVALMSRWSFSATSLREGIESMSGHDSRRNFLIQVSFRRSSTIKPTGAGGGTRAREVSGYQVRREAA